MKKYIIIKKNGHQEPENNTNEFWEDKDYVEYKNKNGMHFSDELAEWASKNMKNANGVKHTWSVEDVKNAFASLGYALPKGYTWGDATYLANFLYSDLAARMKTETEAVSMAFTIMTSDADGYEGMIFNRYTADIMSKNEQVPWAKLM